MCLSFAFWGERIKYEIRSCSVLNGAFLIVFIQFKLLKFDSTKLQLAHKSWSLGAHYNSIHHSCEQLHIPSFLAGSFFGSPSLYLRFFSALTPPCCHNDSNLWSCASCRYVSDDLLAGSGWGFCVIGRKWLMSGLNATQESLQKMSTFSASNISRSWQTWRGPRREPWGTPLCSLEKHCLSLCA